MELGLSLVGQAAKRGLTHRIPKGDALIAAALDQLRDGSPDVIRAVEQNTTRPGRPARLIASLHPAAPPISLTADDTGSVAFEADTAIAGPGYHTWVQRLAERMGEDLDIAWSARALTAPGGTIRSAEAALPRPGQAATSPAPDGGSFAALERAATERAHLAWLRRRLVRVAEARRTGSPTVHLGTPDGVRYDVRAALATVMGPRTDEWLERALSDPRVAVDIWPWFADAMDARYHLHVAGCLLWTEVRWRQAADDAERAVLDEVLEHLRRAYLLDPELPMPWREWLEVIDLRGRPDPLRTTVMARAASMDDAAPRLGYRRAPVTILHDGWRVEVPGDFTEHRTDGRWWGGDGLRSIALTPIVPASNNGLLPPERVLASIAGDLGSEALDHRADGLVGRARMRTDDASGLSVGIVEGFVAIAGRGAAVRVEFDDPAEWQWALDRWRELRPA